MLDIIALKQLPTASSHLGLDKGYALNFIVLLFLKNKNNCIMLIYLAFYCALLDLLLYFIL